MSVFVRPRSSLTPLPLHPLRAGEAQPRPRPAELAPPAKDTSADLPKRSPSSDPPADLADDDRRLYDAIRRWRATEAERAGVPRYVVLTNRDVEALARARPDTLAGLRKIPGIGRAKIEKYGEALLELLHPARNMDDAPRLVPEPAPEAAEA